MCEREQVDICPKLVGEIKGKFKVPSYQRGYRWTKTHVEQLLKDIITLEPKSRNDGGIFPVKYCLQPLVICKSKDEKFDYDLIDGQQRLTTIYILWKFLSKFLPKVNNILENLSIGYQTRTNTTDFLKNIDNSEERKNNEEYIDFYYMSVAYECIENYLTNYAKENGKIIYDVAEDIYNKFFDRNYVAVSFIWYFDKSENPRETFKNLNRGKIVLTNSELVKALLLKDKKESDKYEIANAWYSMEKELQNDQFWYFLANYAKGRKEKNKYQTRIDIVLEMLTNSNLKEDCEDEISYSIFNNIFEIYIKNKGNKDLWKDIKKAYQTLKSWYEDKEFYHKIGYLISVGKSLKDIYNLHEKAETRTTFRKNLLENEIAKSIKNDKVIKYDEKTKKTIVDENKLMTLVYEDEKGNKKDYDEIMKLLLLHNVKTIHFSPIGARFPFDKYKVRNKKQNEWSLEHIDAQNTEGLQTNDEKEQWAKYQNKDLEQLKLIKNKTECENLQKRLVEFISTQNDKTNLFENLSKDVNKFYNDIGEYEEEEKHTIDNLALLNKDVNSALNKSRFGVKRSIIMEYDKYGEYIPFCTRNIFMKYYSLQGKKDEIEIPQLIYWGEKDRDAYKNDICKILEKSWEKEEEKEGKNNARN